MTQPKFHGRLGEEALKKRRLAHTNTLDFAQQVYANREYQYLGRCINAAVQPLRGWYLKTIEVFAGGSSAIAIWHAELAGGSWCSILAEIRRPGALAAPAQAAPACEIVRQSMLKYS